MEQQTEYTLTPDELGLLMGPQADLEAVQGQIRGILNAIIRFRKLGDGQWSLNGDKLVKVNPQGDHTP
jgi:hypothetical protein